MTSKYTKCIFLGLLVVLCMSVTVAAEVTDDTITDVIDTSSINTNVETTTDEIVTDTITTNNNIETEYDTQTETEEVNNPYTFTNTTLDITGNNYDGSTIILLDNVNVLSSNNMQLTGTSFIVNGTNVNITGLNIVNYNQNTVVITVINSENVTINQTNIVTTRTETGKTMGILINDSEDVTVENCNINLTAVSQDLYPAPDYVYTLNTAAIAVDTSHNITLNNNNIQIKNSTNTGSTAGTGEAITIIDSSYDVNVYNNTITGENFPYLYAISTATSSHDILIENNTIALTGINHFCGIQLSSTSNSTVRHNNITGTCTAQNGTTASNEAFAYGIALASSYRPTASESINNIIEYNYINITSNITYAIELSIADNTTVYNNTAYVYGEVVMALGIYNSSYCQIILNNFTVEGNTRDLNPNIYEAIYPVTTGIKINETSVNNTILHNTINVSDNNTNVTSYTIILSGTDYTQIHYNTLYATDEGDPSVTGQSATDNATENNIEET